MVFPDECPLDGADANWEGMDWRWMEERTADAEAAERMEREKKAGSRRSEGGDGGDTGLGTSFFYVGASAQTLGSPR